MKLTDEGQMAKRFLSSACLLITFCLAIDPNSALVHAQDKAKEQEAITKLAQLSAQFSATYMQGDTEKLVSFYTDDAVIFPGNSDLIRGTAAIKKYWTLPAGRTVTHHKITAVEIKVIGDFAHDYGHYEVSGRNGEEAWGPTYGKYLIVWKRNQAGEWKMHLDMWNSRPKPE